MVGQTTSVDEFLDSNTSWFGFGKYQVKKVLLISGGAWWVVGWQVLALSFLVDKLKKNGYDGPDPRQKSAMDSALFVGWGFGCAVLSRLSDQRGRRPIFLVSLAGMIISSLFVSFSSDGFWWAFCRAGTGFFVGGFGLVSYVLQAEFTPSKHSVTVGVLMNGSWAVGAVVLSLVAYMAPSAEALVVLITVPAIVLFLSDKRIPESPKWLVVQRRGQQALEVLSRIAIVNDQELDSDVELDLPPATSDAGSVRTLFSGSLARQTIVMCFNWFVTSMVYYGLTLNPKATGNSDLYVSNALNAIVELVGYLVAGPIINKLGRKLALTVFFAIGGACLLALIVVSDVDGITLLVLIGKLAISSAFVAVYVVASEVFPTEVRNLGAGVCSLAARVGAFSATLIQTGFGEDLTGPRVVYALFGLGAAALTAMLLKDTRRSAQVPTPDTPGTQLQERADKADDAL